MTSSTPSSILLGMGNSTRGYDVEQDEKVRENRLRRMAERRGYRISKVRRHDHKAIDYGGWWVIPPNKNSIFVRNTDNLERMLEES
jgi:hypothetical protein